MRRQRQKHDFSSVFDTELVDGLHYSVRFHFDIRPRDVIVEYQQAVALDLSLSHFSIAMDALIIVPSIQVNPVEIFVGKRLDRLNRIPLVDVDLTAESRLRCQILDVCRDLVVNEMQFSRTNDAKDFSRELAV